MIDYNATQEYKEHTFILKTIVKVVTSTQNMQRISLRDIVGKAGNKIFY